MKRDTGHVTHAISPRASRRTFLQCSIALPALACGSFPFAASAQQSAKIPRVGVVNQSPRLRNAFKQGLAEHDWIDGKNIIIEFRNYDSDPERLLKIAGEFSNFNVACIVASGNLSVRTLKEATAGIPIVMAFAADVVGSGFVANLRQPGGNITGLTNINELLTSKRLELLKELRPKLSRVALMIDPAISAHGAMWKVALASAKSLGLKVFAVEYHSAHDFTAAFAALAQEKAEGLVLPQSPIASFARERVINLAAGARVPAIYQTSSWVEAGGLASYGTDEADMWRRSAGYVDKILKGGKPADLPVEQPTKFELILNRKTANALSIKIPNSILVQANKVID